jgi:hypothetical protein
MKKYKLFFDPRKEEEWLNSIEGYRLVKVNGFSYTFEPSKKKYFYSLNYTPGKMEYLTLMNNLKSDCKEIKHSLGWTYIESKNHKLYRNEEVHLDSLKLFVKKYSLYCRAFLMFGFAFLCLTVSLNIWFIICALILFLLSLLYYINIRTTKKVIEGR